MSKLGRVRAERKMMNCDKHVCLGRATAVAARRGTQPRGPENEGHRFPRPSPVAPAQCQWCCLGEGKGKQGQRTAAIQWAAGENKLLWGGQGEAKARKDGVWAPAAFPGN